MSNKKSIVEFWERIIDKYNRTDHKSVRLYIEAELPNETKKEFEALRDLTFKASDRPCKKRCGRVEKGEKCKSWEEELKNIWDLKPNDSEAIKFYSIKVFFLIHSSAYERWEETFDYGTIGCRLHMASQFLNLVKDDFSDGEKPFLDLLNLMNVGLHHWSLRENSMVANNPKLMKFHSEKTNEYANKIIELCNSVSTNSDWINYLVKVLKEYYESESEISRLTVEITNLMILSRDNKYEFVEKYNQVRESYYNLIEKWEEDEDYEAATEIRAHLKFLDHLLNQKDSSNLHLNYTEGGLIYGFYKEIRDISENSSKKKKVNIDSKNTSELIEYLKDNFESKRFAQFPIEIVSVSQDPNPDILESSVGSAYFENFVLLFKDIEVYNLESEINSSSTPLFTFTPKITHYAMGVGCFELFTEVEKLNVSEFQALKNLATPHSPEYIIKLNGETPKGVNKEITWVRLIDFVEEIIDCYFSSFNLILNQLNNKISDDNKNDNLFSTPQWNEPTQSWFSNFWIYKITNDQGKTLDYEELKQHWQWPGIVAYQRADRATIDDWIKIDLDQIKLKNLGGIRGHKGDAFFISENHSIIYMPDDPKFIINQYVLTSKWVFLIRSLVMYCLISSDDIVHNMKKTIEQSYKALRGKLDDSELSKVEDIIQDRKIELYNYNLLTLNAMDHIASAGVSQYADHGLLLRNAFEEIKLPTLINFLISKIDKLNEQGDEIDSVIQKIMDIRENESSEKLELILTILSILQVIPTIDVIYTIFFSETGPTPDYLLVFFIGLFSLFLCWILLIKLRSRK